MKPSLWIDRGLLIIRVALGLVFVMHGWQKLFVFGHAGMTGFMTQAGLPFPGVNAVLITAAELGGGLAMLLGLQTRLAGAVLAFSMAVAVVTVHLKNGFFLPSGFEYAFTLMLINLGVIATGAGAYSLDAWLGNRKVGVVVSSMKHAA